MSKKTKISNGVNQTKINKILFQISYFSGYVLAVLMILYFISGYGETKGIMNPVFAKTLHEKWLPIPTVIFFILHVFLHIKFRLRKYIKDEKWINIYILILSLVVFILFLYLYLI